MPLTPRTWATSTARRVRRLPLRVVFAIAMPSWDRTEPTADGFTTVIGVKHELLPILEATLDLLDQKELPSQHQVIVVVDRTETPELRAALDRIASDHPRLALQALFYTPRQHRCARLLPYPFLFACLSWCIGIQAARTPTILVHDLDAMLLDPQVLETRYHRMQELGLSWYGDSYRVGLGAVEEDGLVATWEMFLARDAVMEGRPVDVLNRHNRIGDRVVDFDITIWLQHTRQRPSAVEPMPPASFVHPSQVVHQWTEMLRNGVHPAKPGMMILFAPYYMALGGSPDVMHRFTELAPGAPTERVPLADHAIDCSAMTGDFVAMVRRDVAKIETHVAGAVRPDVEAYLAAIEEVGRR